MSRTFWIAVVGVLLAPSAIDLVGSTAQSSVNPQKGPAYEPRRAVHRP